MEKNVGKIDKIIRYILGVVFIILGYKIHWGFYILAAIAIITAALGTCGLYSIFKFNTNKK
jgi:hypothetical protein